MKNLNLKKLKREAKAIKTDTGIPHSEALDIVAVRNGFDNWSLLIKNNAKHELELSQSNFMLHNAEAYRLFILDIITNNDRTELDNQIAAGDQIELHGYQYLTVELLWQLPSEERQKFVGE